MDWDEYLQSSNSELRFLTLELMKLAQEKGVSFAEIAKDYMANVRLMSKLIDTTDSKSPNEPDSTSD